MEEGNTSKELHPMMSISKWAAGAMILAVVIFAAGCGEEKVKDKEAKAKAKEKEKDDHDHDHEGPHDGTVIDWGDHEYHVEFTVDHKTKTARVYILGKDVKTPAPIKADKVMLSIKKPAFQLDLKPEKQPKDPEGTASVFVGTHDNLGKEQEFEGTLSAEFNGKAYSNTFKEKPDHHKKK
jgi:hypothetical protein